MPFTAVYRSCLGFGTVLCVLAGREILTYRQGDGAWRFIAGVVLPFSIGFGLFVAAAQIKKRHALQDNATNVGELKADEPEADPRPR